MPQPPAQQPLVGKPLGIPVRRRVRRAQAAAGADPAVVAPVVHQHEPARRPARRGVDELEQGGAELVVEDVMSGRVQRGGRARPVAAQQPVLGAHERVLGDRPQLGVMAARTQAVPQRVGHAGDLERGEQHSGPDVLGPLLVHRCFHVRLLQDAWLGAPPHRGQPKCSPSYMYGCTGGFTPGPPTLSRLAGQSSVLSGGHHPGLGCLELVDDLQSPFGPGDLGLGRAIMPSKARRLKATMASCSLSGRVLSRRRSSGWVRAEIMSRSCATGPTAASSS